MTRRRSKKTSQATGVLAWCGANRHFVIATLILATSTGVWYLAAETIGLFFMSKPVPWPEGVEIDGQTYQNITLPTTLGKYRRAEEGDLPWVEDDPKNPDGKPDGEITIRSETLEELKIGTALDGERHKDRRSNWYVCRLYIDETGDEMSKQFPLWRLNVYFYTGVVDQVPHVAEKCLVAGGATIIAPANDAERFKAFQVSADPALRAPWNAPVEFKRTRWQVENKKNGRTDQYVQFYVFSMNDSPATDRNIVRLKLADPRVNHSYYAKIEFSPANPVRDTELADKAAERFLAEFLPHVIRALPTRETIKLLDTTNR